MAARRRGCSVGVIPGGTANVWAHEIGMSEDPVKASLLLINSEGCKVDVGNVAVDSFPFAPGKGDGHKEARQARRGRHHFLLMAGLGVDAAIMSQVPTSLKERIGKAAVVLAAVETLPSQHAFPIEVWSSGEGAKEAMRWRGEALQVIVGNTRRYGDFAEATPDALIDDGALDVCIITAGAALSTIEQILSILLNRNPRNGRSERFRDSHFWIRAPASIDLQLDGSRVKLDDGVTAPAEVEVLRITPGSRDSGIAELRIVIREGRHRQVRRMLHGIGHKVQGLNRVGFGPLKLGRLKTGGWRVLGDAEIAALQRAVATATDSPSPLRPSGPPHRRARRRTD
jgi:diacylglycerol kinase family enzyme